MGSTTVQGKLILQSRLEEVSRAENEVLRAAEDHGFEGPDRFAVKLALEEALANAIKHGNNSDPAKRVTLEFAVSSDQIRISVSDEGPGFDPSDVPDPTLDENREKPFGRGVMLMRAYMNDVSFNESGNRVTLVKWRGGKKPKSA